MVTSCQVEYAENPKGEGNRDGVVAPRHKKPIIQTLVQDWSLYEMSFFCSSCLDTDHTLKLETRFDTGS